MNTRGIYIPPGIVGVNALSAGSVSSGDFLAAESGDPLAAAGGRLLIPMEPPRMLQTWMIESFYIPIDVLTVNASGSAQPTTCYLNIFGQISGQVVWASNVQVALIPNSNAVNTAGNTTIAENLFTPIPMTTGQRVGFSYTASFDEAITGGNIGIGQTITNPAANTATAQQGIIGYAIRYASALGRP